MPAHIGHQLKRESSSTLFHLPFRLKKVFHYKFEQTFEEPNFCVQNQTLQKPPKGSRHVNTTAANPPVKCLLDATRLAHCAGASLAHTWREPCRQGYEPKEKMATAVPNRSSLSRSPILKVITLTPLPRRPTKIADFMFQGLPLQATWLEKSTNDKRGRSSEAWVSMYQACCTFNSRINLLVQFLSINFSSMSASLLHFQVYTLPLSAQTCCANRFLWMPSDIGRLGTLTSNCTGGHKLNGCSHQATDRPLRHARSVQPNTWPFRFNGLNE